MAAWIFERFVPLLIRLSFVFEPLTPRFVSFFLKRRLREWKDKGLINDYETMSERIGKFHYKIDVNFVLTREQARNILCDFVVKGLRKEERTRR